MTSNIACKICKTFFLFNNALHRHFRIDKCTQIFDLTKFSMIKINHINAHADTRKISSNQFVTIDAQRLTIISLKVDFNENINTNYDFKD